MVGCGKHGVRKEQASARNRPMEDGAPLLWELAAEMIRDAVDKSRVAE
jgi:hypothetical protein